MIKKFEILNQALIINMAAKANRANRKRLNYNFHEQTDNVQRMLNAVEPDSYVCPHRHLNPPKIENFILLRGSLAVIIFNDDGSIAEKIILHKDNIGIDIKPGVWHTIISLEPGTVVFEVKDGPYVPATDKDFAPFAPREGDPLVSAYLETLKKLL